MPHCIVLQPNGKYAVWSTIVDNFLVLDCTADEAINHELDRDIGGYPGGVDSLRKSLQDEKKHIEEIGTAWDWAGDWNHYVRWCEITKNKDMLQIIDNLGLPRRMKRKASTVAFERYWRYFWRNRAEALSFKLRFGMDRP